MSKASIINALQSCIDDSNETTGRNDTNVTDCVNRLISGYGGGGTNIIADVDVTADGTEYISFACTEEPDAVIIYAKNWTIDDGLDGTIGFSAVKNYFASSERKGASGSFGSGFGAMHYNDISYPWGLATGNGGVSGSYDNNVFSARARGGEYYRWNTAYTYRCLAIKF